MVSWGIVALLFTWVQNVEQLFVLRFLLGVAEAGFFPGAILFLSLWVPAQYRGKILVLFYLAQPLTTVIGAPLAGWLIQQNEVFFGLEGWRFMFFGVAIPAIVVGIIAWFYLTDKPTDAKWLTHEEQVWLTDALEPRRRPPPEEGARPASRPASPSGSGRVWMLSFIYFGFIYGLYAWPSSSPRSSRASRSIRHQVRRLPEGPDHGHPVPAGRLRPVLLVQRRHQARREDLAHRAPRPRRRPQHPARPVRGLPGRHHRGHHHHRDVPSSPRCRTSGRVPTQFLTGAAAAAGIALINTIGNLAGFGAGYVTGWLQDLTGGYTVPMFVVGCFMLLSAVLMVVLAAPARSATASPPRL